MKKCLKPSFFASTYCYLAGELIFYFFILSLVYFFTGGRERISFLIVAGTICISLILLTCYYIVIYHTMSYEIYGDEIVLRCGLFKSKIPYEKIKKIEKIADLGFAPVGWCRFPRFLLGDVYFARNGWITMYATSYKNVLLIETEDKKRYGITPSKEEDFLRILNEKLKKREI